MNHWLLILKSCYMKFTFIHKSNSKEEIIGITKNNKIETDPTILGNTFNEFFTTIAKKLT